MQAQGREWAELEPLLGRDGRLAADGRGENIGLECLGTARDGEGDGLNVRVIDGLESPHDLILVDLTHVSFE